MKNYILIAITFCITLSLNSCYVNRTTIGDGPMGKIDGVKFSKVKQMYLVWGLIPLGHSQPVLPQQCGYQVKSCFNFWDALVSSITGGIFSMRTVKIIVYKNGQCDPAVRKLERKVEKKELKEHLEEGK